MSISATQFHNDLFIFTASAERKNDYRPQTRAVILWSEFEKKDINLQFRRRFQY